jgi:hypothetical protein
MFIVQRRHADGFGSVFVAPLMRALTDRHPQLEIQILRSARLQPAETFRHRREA